MANLSQDSQATIAVQLAASKIVTTLINGTWQSDQQLAPDVSISAIGTPPGGFWRTKTVRPALTMTRDTPPEGYSGLMTMQTGLNLSWVANPTIPSQPYVAFMHPSVIAAQTASNYDLMYQNVSTQKVVSVPVAANTASFNTTTTVPYNITSIPFMRQHIIEFVVNGLRPYARHYISFDDTRMDDSVTTIAAPYTFGNPIISDASGKIIGLIRIPPNKFRCGQHIITVSDANLITDSVTSVAKAIFVASGYLDANQSSYMTSKNATTRVSFTLTYTDIPAPISPVVPLQQATS